MRRAPHTVHGPTGRAPDLPDALMSRSVHLTHLSEHTVAPTRVTHAPHTRTTYSTPPFQPAAPRARLGLSRVSSAPISNPMILAAAQCACARCAFSLAACVVSITPSAQAGLISGIPVAASRPKAVAAARLRFRTGCTVPGCPPLCPLSLCSAVVLGWGERSRAGVASPRQLLRASGPIGRRRFHSDFIGRQARAGSPRQRR